MADKVDLKKSLDAYQARRGQFRIVDVPELQYLTIDGHGDPNTSPSYAEALNALYPIAYALKFASKRELGFSNGGHGLRHSYAQQRMNDLQQRGMRYDQAKGTVAQEVGHFDKETTEAYLR